MKKQNIEEIFSSIEHFSSVPPPELWGQIEEKLNQPKKSKKAIIWWAAAACLLVGLMVPTVLHFNSGADINTFNTDSNNTVVLEEKNSGAVKNSSTNKNTDTKSNTVQENTTKQIVNSENGDAKNIDKETIGEKVIEAQSAKTATAAIENSPEKNNTTKVQNTTIISNAVTRTAHSEAKKATNRDVVLDLKQTETRSYNQAVAVKSNTSKKENTFDDVSKQQMTTAEKNNLNKAVANQSFSPKTTDKIAVSSTDPISKKEKDLLDKAVAENTFKTKKQKSFISTPEKQLSGSVLDEKANTKNNTAIALNGSNSVLNEKQNKNNQNAVNPNFNSTALEKSIADNTAVNGNSKNASKFGDALTKQDSVQLAELQNLEKGIIVAEVTKEEKEKEDKAVPKSEKWDLGVFAGVANSENYKNEKTLGNVNDSKQSNSYGVKTRYKINKKWAVGSGLKFNELGQSIANVAYMSTKNEASFSQSDYLNQSVTAVKPHIANNSNYVFISNTTRNSFKSNNIETGNVNQSLKYIEMPLEVSYAVLTLNKASVSLNTGGFVGKLVSNNVSLNGTSIGENIDANEFVYGSVLSSTVQYRVYKKTNLFVEPAMNYYVNPLNNQSFNQFQWGLNFGLNVSF
ncbi:hypothetical protein B4N84_13150 [Flavobacterium sp. IR1]|nr:hypothetical protein B4N84_13150 [Flavobacterium sp. IR1]